jgi:seryl-tRNA(Sec) selenium transferase
LYHDRNKSRESSERSTVTRKWESSKGDSDFYIKHGVERVINARSYSTKLGGCRLPAPILEAMRSASESCVRMEDLQEAASAVIAAVTAAEAGIVTSGASAALTLAAAACLTGFDINKMNRLPDTSEMPNEIVIHKVHRNDYDHALRLAGARLVEAGFAYYTFPYDVESLITDRTVALFYLAGTGRDALPLPVFVNIAHNHGLPVIVDAAAALPPAENLRAFIAAGADLVAFSGGKHIQGPQASGILCGRKDLVLAAALQHQDMDVFPETWPLRKLIHEGIVPSPPHHGIGRGFKAGKEEIAGLLAALELYQHRDFDAELARWRGDIETIQGELTGINGVTACVVFPDSDGKPVPSAHVAVELPELTANDVINHLQSGHPPICVYETLASTGIIVLYPEALEEGDASLLGKRLREVFTQ